eukprot:g2913.t1
MQLSELASLLSLATNVDSTVSQGLDAFFKVAGESFPKSASSLSALLEFSFTVGIVNLNRRLSDIFLEFLRLTPFSSKTAIDALKCLQLDLIAKRALSDDDFLNINTALKNGMESVKPRTLALFLCFTTPLSKSDRLEAVLAILNNHAELEMLNKHVLLGIIPDLILVAYAASVLVDPTWNPANVGFGTLSFAATKALLSGIVEVTFEDRNQGMYISVILLFPFLESCARNLSDLLLQQTLLEHRVLHSSSSERNLQPQIDSTSLLINQSRRLFEKYVRHPGDLELVMSAVWKERWTVGGYSSPTEEAEIQQQEIEVTAVQEILPNFGNSVHHESPSNLHVRSQPLAPGPSQGPIIKNFDDPSASLNQNEILQRLQQLTGDLGRRLGLLLIGRFFLLASILCGSGALGFFLVNQAGLSVELSLLCVCGVDILFTIGAMYLAGNGCSQSSVDVANNMIGVLHNDKAKGIENSVSVTSGFQPMMKVVVDSLVPQHSACSMTPLRHGNQGHQPFRRQQQQEAPESLQRMVVPEHYEANLERGGSMAETSVPMKLKGIVTTVSRFVARLEKASVTRQSEFQEMEFVNHQSTSKSVYLKSPKPRQTQQDILMSAYPHLTHTN